MRGHQISMADGLSCGSHLLTGMPCGTLWPPLSPVMPKFEDLYLSHTSSVWWVVYTTTIRTTRSSIWFWFEHNSNTLIFEPSLSCVSVWSHLDQRASPDNQIEQVMKYIGEQGRMWSLDQTFTNQATRWWDTHLSWLQTWTTMKTYFTEWFGWK